MLNEPFFTTVQKEPQQVEYTQILTKTRLKPLQISRTSKEMRNAVAVMMIW